MSPKNAKLAQKSGSCAVFHQQPFVLIQNKNLPEGCGLWDGPIVLKIDPGYTTGLAIVSNDCVLWAAQIEHRSVSIVSSLSDRASLRRGRRSRNTPYREARWKNRVRPDGWLPPSTMSLLENIITWASRICAWCPVAEIWVEKNKFDPAKHLDPSITGKAYQQGPLKGHRKERDFLLAACPECCYCGRTKQELKKLGIPLERDHYRAKSCGGSNSLKNSVLACEECNKKKHKKDGKTFSDGLVEVRGVSLAAMSVMNQIRHRLPEDLAWECEVDVSTFSGKETSDNRKRLYGEIKKDNRDSCHWLDAACIGPTPTLSPRIHNFLVIEARGHGTRQMCQTDKYGFPKCHRKSNKQFGIRTGDTVKKKEDGRCGLVIGARSCGSMKIRFSDEEKDKSVTWKKLTVVQKADGYGYELKPLPPLVGHKA